MSSRAVHGNQEACGSDDGCSQQERRVASVQEGLLNVQACFSVKFPLGYWEQGFIDGFPQRSPAERRL
ncbi:unnamed protein product [Caretta caretta]